MGAVAGVVKHGRGPGAPGARGGHGGGPARAERGSVLPIQTGVGLRGHVEVSEPAARAAPMIAAAARRRRQGVTVRRSEPVAGLAPRRVGGASAVADCNLAQARRSTKRAFGSGRLRSLTQR